MIPCEVIAKIEYFVLCDPCSFGIGLGGRIVKNEEGV